MLLSLKLLLLKKVGNHRLLHRSFCWLTFLSILNYLHYYFFFCLEISLNLWDFGIKNLLHLPFVNGSIFLENIIQIFPSSKTFKLACDKLHKIFIIHTQLFFLRGCILIHLVSLIPLCIIIRIVKILAFFLFILDSLGCQHLFKSLPLFVPHLFFFLLLRHEYLKFQCFKVSFIILI
mgnify:CR=1 FL=1